MIESKYDKVFKQTSQQTEIYNFVKGNPLFASTLL